MATGDYFIGECQLRLNESLSTGAQQQSQLYPRHIIRSADEVAQKLFCLYAVATTDLIAGQLQYEMPRRPFRFETVHVNDGNGNVYPLAGISQQAADARFFNWNAQPPQTPPWSGVPQFYVDSGGKTVWIIPVANYSQQDGIMVGGYFGVDGWWDIATECPLEEQYDEAIITGACYRRCIEMLGSEPGYEKKLPLYKGMYDDIMRRHYRNRIGSSEATREAIPSLGKQMGYWSGWGLWG